MHTTLGPLAALALCTAASSASAAAFVGDLARFQYGLTGSPPLLDTTVEVADPGVEVDFTISRIDVAPTLLVVTYDLSGFGGVGATTWSITDLDAGPGSEISGFSLRVGDPSLVVDAAFTGDALVIDFAAMSADADGAEVDFFFDIETSSVPGPAALPLLLSGLAATGLLVRRRARG